MRPMSWLPRNVGSEYAFESASVYQSSAAKNFASVSADDADLPSSPLAKPDALAWKPKSTVACRRPSVVYCDMNAGLASKTSPNMKKSSLPSEAA